MTVSVNVLSKVERSLEKILLIANTYGVLVGLISYDPLAWFCLTLNGIICLCKLIKIIHTFLNKRGLKYEMKHEKIKETKRDILCNLADCMSQISCAFDKLSNSCRPELKELITVLENEQDEFAFANEEANAIGKYFRDKGYDKETMQLMVEHIMNYWN